MKDQQEFEFRLLHPRTGRVLSTTAVKAISHDEARAIGWRELVGPRSADFLWETKQRWMSS